MIKASRRIGWQTYRIVYTLITIESIKSCTEKAVENILLTWKNPLEERVTMLLQFPIRLLLPLMILFPSLEAECRWSSLNEYYSGLAHFLIVIPQCHNVSILPGLDRMRTKQIYPMRAVNLESVTLMKYPVKCRWLSRVCSFCIS